MAREGDGVEQTHNDGGETAGARGVEEEEQRFDKHNDGVEEEEMKMHSIFEGLNI